MVDKKFKGCIIKESLTNDTLIKNLEIVKTRVVAGAESGEKWHIYNVLVSEEEINKLHKYLKKGWYIHFWKGNKMIVLFKGKKFNLKIDDKETWKPAIKYGLSIGISKEELDFEMEF